jgi:hypothetical protein
MSVGVIEDYKLRDLRDSHTLGWSNPVKRKFEPVYTEIFFSISDFPCYREIMTVVPNTIFF